MHVFKKYAYELMESISDWYLEAEEDMEDWQLPDLSFKLMQPFIQAKKEAKVKIKEIKEWLNEKRKEDLEASKEEIWNIKNCNWRIWIENEQKIEERLSQKKGYEKEESKDYMESTTINIRRSNEEEKETEYSLLWPTNQEEIFRQEFNLKYLNIFDKDSIPLSFFPPASI